MCPISLHSSSVFIFFFFFQAEDGIRDGHVTGVQTCALPIYLGTGTKYGYSGLVTGEHLNAAALLGGRPVGALRMSNADRSEERRVGKECRAGGGQGG